MEIKIEHNKVKVGEPTSIGLMLEVTAPTAPQAEAAVQRTPKGIVFVVDRSGSMGNGRLTMVRDTLLDTIGRLDPADYLSIVSFDDEARIDVPMAQVVQHSPRDLVQRISGMRPGGSTNLERGYRMGLAQAAQAPAGIEITLILLSDGRANAGAMSPVILGQLAAAATEHFVTTSTLGIGAGYDENILDALSDSGRGNHIAALELPEAISGLQAEINDLLMKTALNITVEIEFEQPFLHNMAPSRVRTVRRLRKFATTPLGATAVVGDLASGEEKNVVFDLSVAHGFTEKFGAVPAFTVRWSYLDAVTGTTQSGSRTFDLELVDPAAWVEPKRDDDIVAELKAIRLKDVRERALELYADGREDEADALLNKAGVELKEFMESAKGLSARSRMRMESNTDEFTSFAEMRDLNEKRKRMREMNNRANNDKRNFRDDN